MSGRLGAFGTVGGLVPLGFGRYVQLAAADPGDAGGDGGLSIATLAELSEVLASGRAGTSCSFGIWKGHGWLHRGGLVSIWDRDRGAPKEALGQIQGEANAPAFPSEILEGPKLGLPHRNYLLLRGPLDAASQMGREHFGRFEIHPPDLIWPETRDWFVGTDTDLTVAYVGGSEWLLNRIAERPRLAAIPVSTDDWLGEIEPNRLGAP